MPGPSVTETTIRKVLTRTSGFLRTVTSHSLQPYAGCSYGRTLCGVGCYARANRWITKGRTWGDFLEVRTNAADSYREHAPRERAWAHRRDDRFSVFLSSSTDPFVPHERRHRVTASVLEAMRDEPPDVLVVQTHSPTVLDARDALVDLAARCELRVHVSVESDIDAWPGLPRPAAPAAARLDAAGTLRAAGLHTVITVAPWLPMRAPRAFFERVTEVADAVVLDHFVGGDGTPDGRRTRATALPAAMETVAPGSTDLAALDEAVAIARAVMPGRVGVSIDGFAGRLLP